MPDPVLYGYSAGAPRQKVNGVFTATPINGDVLSVIQSPASYARTDPSVQGLWFPVPAETIPGAVLTDGVWVNPPPP
jgi:hypothetical protein